MQRIDTEDDQSVQIALIEALEGGAFDSSAATSTLIRFIEGSDKAAAGYAARALSRMKSPPPAALPILFNNLDLDHPFSAQYFLDAIRTYGPEAKGYLPRLEKLQTEAKDDHIRARLSQTVAAIRSVGTN